MKSPKKDVKINLKQLEQTIRAENDFMENLLTMIHLPNRDEEEEMEGSEEEKGEQEEEEGMENEEGALENGDRKPVKSFDPKSRAQSGSELQHRLQSITLKKQLNYTDRMKRKVLKNRLKKKSKQTLRNEQKKNATTNLGAKDARVKKVKVKKEKPSNDPKPVFNKEGKVVFSKIDFSGVGANKKRKDKKDPRENLKELQQQKQTLTELEQKGEFTKVVQIREKTAWKNALSKVAGEKVRDDPALLKKTVKRIEGKKRSSKKKWESRLYGVEKAKEERQKKRTENIQKRKDLKKGNKLKKAEKKGRVIHNGL